LVKSRGGAGSLGCLFTLLIVAALVYFGINVGEGYWRFYQFQDDMRQEVRFAAHTQNDLILSRLRASADSLGLPDDAHAISLHRTEHLITIEAAYDERIELPGYARDVHFHPHAEGPL
jgi:hypothetical protein